MGRGAEHRGDEPVCRWGDRRVKALCVQRGLYQQDVGLLQVVPLFSQRQNGGKGVPVYWHVTS